MGRLFISIFILCWLVASPWVVFVIFGFPGDAEFSSMDVLLVAITGILSIASGMFWIMRLSSKSGDEDIVKDRKCVAMQIVFTVFFTLYLVKLSRVIGLLEFGRFSAYVLTNLIMLVGVILFRLVTRSKPQDKAEE